MLPRIAQLLQLKATYSGATRDYVRLSKAIDASQLSLSSNYLGAAMGVSSGAGGVARRAASGRQGSLNSLDDDDGTGDLDDISHGKRGASMDHDDEAAMRAAEFQKHQDIKGTIKSIRAKILFRKIPMTLSRIERLLKPNRRLREKQLAAKQARQEQKLQRKLLAKSGGGSSSASRKAIAAGGKDPSSATAPSANPAAAIEEDEMLDLMFMGTADAAVGGDSHDGGASLVPHQQSGGGGDLALKTSDAAEEDQLAAESAASADHFLFAAEMGQAGTTPSGRALPLHQHVSLANVTRFLDTLAYFEGQREIFLYQQTAEYSKAKAQIKHQIHMRHRKLAKEYNRAMQGVQKASRPVSMAEVANDDPKMEALRAQLAEVEEREALLDTSIIARPYTSARMWVAVLKFPVLSEGSDPTLRIPYARALSKMLTGIMRVVAQRGSNNCINTESPRFVSSMAMPSSSSSRAKHGGEQSQGQQQNNTANGSNSTDALAVANGGGNDALAVASSAEAVAGWIPSPSRSAIELLLLSLVRLAKVFDAIAADCAIGADAKAFPLPSSASAVMLSETLSRTQRVATTLMVAVKESLAGDQHKEDPHAIEVLSLVHPTLMALDAAMTRVNTAMVAALLPPTSRASAGDAVATIATDGAGNKRVPPPVSPRSVDAFARKNFVAKLSPPSAVLLISRLYQLKCFHPDTSRDSKHLLYLLITKAFPQASSRTRSTLVEGGEQSDLTSFITERSKAHMRRKGVSNREALDDPVHEAKLQKRRMSALLRTRRLEASEQSRAEMMGLTTPFTDLMRLYECLSHAASSCAHHGSGKGGGGPFIVNTRAYRLTSPEAIQWHELFDVALPHVAEAIISRSAADKQLAVKSDAGVGGGGMDLAQVAKLLQLSTPLLAKAQKESLQANKMRHAAGGRMRKKTASVAFYQFLLSEIKVKLGARLHQEAARRKVAQSDGLVGRSGAGAVNMDAEHLLKSSNVAPINPILFVSIVAEVGQIVSGVGGNTPLNAAGKEVLQIAKGLLVEDATLVAALKPLAREVDAPPTTAADSNAASRGGKQNTANNRRRGNALPAGVAKAQRHSELYAMLLDGFQQGNALSSEFHNYLVDVL